MKKIWVYIVAAALLVGCSGQGKKDTVNYKAEEQLLTEARRFFEMVPGAEESHDPVMKARVKLGQRLFYDNRLSRNGTVSCNSCHNLSQYGVDNLATSIGDAGTKGDRNSPTVFNASLHNMQFWDGRARDVEEQSGMPILNKDEMAIPHEGFLISRLQKDALYSKSFREAFPGKAEAFTYNNVQRAIGTFERTLVSPSRFDTYMWGKTDTLTREEKAGLKLFMSIGCTVCHDGVGIGGKSMQKFGLVTDYRTLTHSKYNDEGKKQVTGKAEDKDVFKVQGLRNVAKTYPYFHDGSVASLDSTVQIMSKVQLDRKLTPEEVKLLVSFLNTLTGEIRSEAKVNPFQSIN